MLIFCVFTLIGGGCKASVSVTDDDEPKTGAARDAEIAKELAKSPEARQWLAASNHAMFEITKEDASALVEAAYAAGAPKVYMSEPEPIEGQGEIGSTIVIELPVDKAARKRIFDAEAAWWKKHGDETPSKDEEQKYLEVFTD